METSKILLIRKMKNTINKLNYYLLNKPWLILLINIIYIMLLRNTIFTYNSDVTILEYSGIKMFRINNVETVTMPNGTEFQITKLTEFDKVFNDINAPGYWQEFEMVGKDKLVTMTKYVPLLPDLKTHAAVIEELKRTRECWRPIAEVSPVFTAKTTLLKEIVTGSCNNLKAEIEKNDCKTVNQLIFIIQQIVKLDTNKLLWLPQQVGDLIDTNNSYHIMLNELYNNIKNKVNHGPVVAVPVIREIFSLQSLACTEVMTHELSLAAQASQLVLKSPHIVSLASNVTSTNPLAHYAAQVILKAHKELLSSSLPFNTPKPWITTTIYLNIITSTTDWVVYLV